MNDAEVKHEAFIMLFMDCHNGQEDASRESLGKENRRLETERVVCLFRMDDDYN
jgi:hypothetical protein